MSDERRQNMRNPEYKLTENQRMDRFKLMFLLTLAMNKVGLGLPLDLHRLQREWPKISDYLNVKVVGGIDIENENSMMLRAKRYWTPEQIKYLEEHWGMVAIPTIARKVKKSYEAVREKAYRIGLGRWTENGNYITFNQLNRALRGHNVNVYQLKSWVANRDFPVKVKNRGGMKIRVVMLNEFWEWAEKHRDIIDFSQMPHGALGAEPPWVDAQRKHDASAAKVNKTPWTPKEDSQLRTLVEANRYTWREVADRMHRTEGAVQRRLCNLGIKARPIRIAPHDGAWTKGNIETVLEMIRQGASYADIGRTIGKSEKAVRGKMYQRYRTESQDKIRRIMKG